jgi:acetyl-CoA synthetase
MEIKPGSIGRPCPGWPIRLLDLAGEPCPPGEEGEICIDVSGPRPVGLFREYLDEPERTASVLYDGYYHTGDKAWMDEDGYIWFLGRVDDLIKSSGYRIGPFEVESALVSHPAVVEAAVTGVPDEVRGQAVKATIVLAAGFEAGDELKRELQNHVKKVTAPYKYPRVIEFVAELPKTISGKIKRAEIRDRDLNRN